MRISDWSSDVCSSDLLAEKDLQDLGGAVAARLLASGDTYRLHARTLRRSQKLAARNANPTRTNAMPRTTNHHSPPKKRSSTRSAERRVGKECLSTCSFLWSPSP